MSELTSKREEKGAMTELNDALTRLQSELEQDGALNGNSFRWQEAVPVDGARCGLHGGDGCACGGIDLRTVRF